MALQENHLLEAPYVSVGIASPQKKDEIETQARERRQAKRAEIPDLDGFKLKETQSEETLAAIGAQVKRIPFTSAPPRTFDDSIKYRVLRAGRGIPMVVSDFATASKVDAGLAFDLNAIPRD